MKIFRSSRTLGIILSAATLLAVGSMTSAAATSDNGRINSCVAKDGSLRVTDTSKCRTNEKPLAWNEKGPAGPKGATGPGGPPGPPAATIAGTCTFYVPKTVHAGDRMSIPCRHEQPFQPRAVVLTPAYSDSSADSLYILEAGLDYSYYVDWESGDANEFVVLIHILRDVVPPFQTFSDNYGLLFNYRA